MDKKYTSLEHSIRNIMTESIGAIGTDKFTKTGNSFFRSFHAEPKKGDTHPNGNAIRAARNVSKEGGSQTMNSVTEEEQLDEFNAPPIKPPAPTIPRPKITPKVDEPKVEPEIPAKPEKVPEKTPKEVPVETPKEVPEKTPTETPKPKQEPASGAKPEGNAKTDGVPKTEPSGKEKGGAVPDGKKTPNTKVETPTNKVKAGFPIISFPLAVNPLLGAYGGTNVRTFMHSPQEYMESTEADKIRQSIENVARPGGKNKITKQAELKSKIIEDNNRKANIVRAAIKEKKAGQNPLVDTKPKLNDLELDEKFVGRAATVGAAGAVGYGGVLDKPKQMFNKYKSSEEQEKALKGQKDFLGVPNERYGGVDTALDFTTMVPGPIGTASAIYSTKRAYDRGDYVDAGLNAVSAIPLLGTVIKGAKFLGKGAAALGKSIQKGGTVASDVATGVQLGDIPHIVDKMSKETGTSKTDLYKDIGNTLYSDIKTDVVDPVMKKIKKPAIEVFGGPTSSAPGKKLSP